MKARVFNIMQYEYHPDDYNGDGTIKDGSTPLITQQGIIDALKSHRTIKQYAYIWHDKDTVKDESEIANGSENKKPKHVHIVLSCPSQVDLSAIAKWFDIPENFIDVPKGRGAFLDCVEYLTHESEKEQAKGKYLYPDNEVVANFDFRAELTVRVQRKERYGSDASNKMTDADEMRLHVLQDGWNMKQCRDYDALTYFKVRDSLPKLRLDYLLDQPPCPFRFNIYVDGRGRLGKGTLCEYIAESLFPGVDKAFFTVGSDSRVTFDGYDGEPVIIWDDYRSSLFMKNFGRGGTFNLLDSHPKQQAQQAKHSRVILTNAINIINSVEPYQDFLDGLSGAFTDKDGVFHQAEDKNQAYGRLPMIMCVREDDFDIMFNRGFVNKDSYAYHQYDMYERVRGSIMNVASSLSGKARHQVLSVMTKPALDCYNMIVGNHDDKISDPDLIPDEFKNYGTTVSPEEFAEAEEMRKIDNLFLFVNEYVRAVTPKNEKDVLRCCREALSYADNFSYNLFYGVTPKEKQQILDDVKEIGKDTLSAFIMREYSQYYFDDIPEEYLQDKVKVVKTETDTKSPDEVSTKKVEINMGDRNY